jgi:TonB-linked SusC/RagA family outer membrane protein
VTVSSLGLGSTTRGDGTYTILVPAARIPTGAVTVTARLIGYKLASAQVTLEAGSATADFALADNPLQLGEVVVTGAGTTSEVEKLGTVRNPVEGDAIVRSQEQNLVNGLAAKAPNVTVYSSSGDPGASSYIQIRGLTTIQAGDGQPLFVVDGAPVGNTTDYSNLAQLGLNGGNTFPPNRLLDLNPDDIESVEILKGASSGAIYGSRAGQGVVLITTKHGRSGQARYSLRSAWTQEEHTQLPALQRQFGLGSNGVSPSCVPGPNSPVPDPTHLNCGVGFGNAGSWGPAIAAGTPTFDHASDIFHHGYTTDNNLTVSGGSDRTEYFLSGGYNYNNGIVIGDNNHYRRISVRANGSQRISDNLKIGANIAYSNGSGGFVQSRNSTAGLLLGSWRTTPTFNNLPYLDPTFGLQRSYRFPNPGPGSEQTSRRYDNPFFTANANPTTSDVGRTFGGLNAEWAVTSWFKFNENLGYDYSNDERFESWAWSNSNSAPPAGVIGLGGVNAGYIRNTQVDQSLTATVSYSASAAWKGTFTVGQDLNSQTAQSRQTLGAGLITPQPFNLGNTSILNTPAYDFYQKIHLESYFAQATADLWDQFYLTGAIRNDGASSFGAASRHNWYPKGSAAWVFKKAGTGAITYGKLRAAYGQSGTQPPPYLLGGTFVSQTIGDGGWGPATSTQINGLGGLLTNFNLPTQSLGPERVKEFEAGFDLGLLNDKADLSVTHYRSTSSDVILQIPVPTSTGFFQVAANAASLQNRGWEVSLNLRPVTTKDFAWDLGLQWARNRGITTALAPGLQFYQFPLSGGGNGAGLAVGGVAQVGQPIGAYRGTDFVRCGRGLTSDEGVDIDNTAGHCQGAAAGTLYIGPSGFPELDFNNTYVLGDPNPDWTGSLRTNFRIGKLSLGGLLDVRSGGIAYNGTKGALQHFGVAQNTADTRNAAPVVFGTGFYPANVDPTNPSHAVAGPGVGVAVPLDQGYWQGIGSVFNGNDAAFLEPGHFVKIREISLGYTLDQPWVSRSLGFSSIELRVAGRNLTSWNDYTGVDPETSLLGAVSPVRGLNYFNNPQSRSWSFSLTLNR